MTAFQQEREDLAAAFQMAAKLGYNEAVANHFSLATSEDGKQFLINPNQRHFALIKASDILHLDADDPGERLCSELLGSSSIPSSNRKSWLDIVFLLTGGQHFIANRLFS